MRTLQVDIEGLDLVLGGGFSLLERVAGAGESATILVRGPAGSGKTVLGTQIAASVARAFNSDVAYGCVELLPAELRAQHESVRGKSAKEKVVLLNEDAAADPDSGQVRVYAGLLDLGEEGNTIARFGDAVEMLLDSADARANRKVQVLVIDSLSDGYGLGASAPRILADGVSKLAAERGIVVILLEEQAHEGSSVWSFAVDTVFELKPAEEGTPFDRRLLVSKNRLGPSDPGPHEFSVRPRDGVVIYPRVTAYQQRWRNAVLRKKTIPMEIIHPWYPDGSPQNDWLPHFREVTTAVVGSDSIAVRRMAMWLGGRMPASFYGPHAKLGSEIRLALGATGSPDIVKKLEAKYDHFSVGWGPVQSGSRMLTYLRREIKAQEARGEIPFRVVIGDLYGINYHSDPKGVVQAISVVASWMRDMKIPLVLYETSDVSHAGSVATLNASVFCTCLGGLKRIEEQDDETQSDTPRQSESLTVRLGTFWRSEEFTLSF